MTSSDYPKLRDQSNNEYSQNGPRPTGTLTVEERERFVLLYSVIQRKTRPDQTQPVKEWPWFSEQICLCGDNVYVSLLIFT